MTSSRKHLRGLAAGLVLAIAGPAGIAVGSNSHPVGEASHPDVGALFGTVLDPDGDPAEGVCVKTVEKWQPYRETERTRTSADGHFFFDSLRPTAHLLWINPNCDGSRVRGRYATEWFENAALAQDARILRIGADATKEVTVRLRDQGVIDLRVSDADDAAVTTCARVYAADQFRFDVSRPDSTSGRDAVTIREVRVLAGHASISGLAPGAYRMLVGCVRWDRYEAPADYGYLPRWIDVTVASGSVTPVDADLSPAGVIAGRIEDQFGRYVWGTVSVHGSTRNVVSSTWGSTTGYMSNRLAPGRYRLRAEGYAPYTCEPEFGCYNSGFFGEWFDDHADTYATATPLTVVAGQATIANLEVRLSSPDVAVTNFDVTKAYPRTDAGDLPAGIKHVITFDVEELRGVGADQYGLAVWVEATTPNGRTYYEITREYAYLFPARGKRAYRFEFGQPIVGDLRFVARVCAGSDADRSNDRASEDTFVVVGGMGTVSPYTAAPYPLSNLGGWRSYQPWLC